MQNINAALTLEVSAHLSPEKAFLTTPDHQNILFSQLEEKAAFFAGILIRTGISNGDNIGIMIPNTPEFFYCFFGALKVGAVITLINPASPAPELTYFLANSECVSLITSSSASKTAFNALEEAKVCRSLVIINPENEEHKYGARSVHIVDFKKSTDIVYTSEAKRPDEPCTHIYTSGTTGRPKAAVLTHFNYYYFSQLLYRDLWRLTPDDVVLMLLPASHSMGQAILMATCAARAKLVLFGRMEMSLLLDAIEKEKVTFLPCVPTIASYLLNSKLVSQFDTSSLRKIMISGASASEEIVRKLEDSFNIDVTTALGMTEAIPCTFATPEMNAPKASAGKPIWGTEIRIVNAEGEDLPNKAKGEILIRGPQVFQGYYKDPAANQIAFEQGWFHTGDIGYLDDQGFLFVVDRLKDMIKCSGYAVFPAEVERVLNNHPNVLESAVIGVPNDTLGEWVKAYVVLKSPNSVTENELIAFCRENLASYKCPREIVFTGELRKSGSGKILRRLLRASANL